MTLTEVLMSLLVMGIGVTSVATLFPLAVLRGARATQLTAGTILKENAEETVRFSNSPSLEAPAPTVIGGVPTGAVTIGEFPKGTSPGVNSRAMLRDPDANGSASLCGPVAGLKNYPDNSIVWGSTSGGATPYVANGDVPRKYVVDPLGAAALANDGNPATSPFFYGAFATSTSAATDQFGTVLGGDTVLRFAWPYPYEMIAAAEGGNGAVQRQMIETAYNIVGRAGDYGTDIDADALVTYRDGGGDPDYLEVTFDARDAADGSLEEFFPQDNTDPAPAGADLARMVLFEPNQSGSAAIPLVQLRDQSTIDVVPAGGRTIRLALPRTDFLAATALTADGATALLRVRLERPDRRYSWMLTCRKSGTGREAGEVAVFFNRALSAEDESVWRCLRSATGSYVLFWDEGATPPQRNPQVKGGSWFLEMGELSWLQVGRVLEGGGDPSPGGDAPANVQRLFATVGSSMTTPRYLEFLLSSETPRRNEAGQSGSLFGTFPRGVVSVYTLNP
ncbi:type IV pilus modification PilV family protein [Alienimonas chondri]|uniref:type IV pilus modification PilV family protein n=1 Tax=Alienimonas chondri TaxID=2681879 RepID=UPI0014897269|nr:hypothetical protein [Alienimonas chondri]